MLSSGRILVRCCVWWLLCLVVLSCVVVCVSNVLGVGKLVVLMLFGSGIFLRW